MTSGFRHALLAGLVFAAVAGGFLWFTGALSGGKRERTTGASGAKHAAGDGEKGEAERHGDHDGHGHEDKAEKAPRNADIKDIEQKKCEHDIRQIECQECRYELGVVKVQPSVTDAITKTAVVGQSELGRKLRLTGEVQFDRTGMVDVVPVSSGRVVSVRARLGQRVQQGDVLAVIHSAELGEAKASFLEAKTTADIAGREKDRQSAVASALEKLIEGLSKGQGASHAGNEPLGEWRSRLVGAASRLQQAKAVFEREKHLVAKDASSKAELETAEREWQTAQADYAALTEEVHLNLRLDRLKAENAARLAEARLAASEQRLHVFGLDHETIQAIPLAKDNGKFAQLEIKAPRPGVITAQNVTEGRYVEPTHVLCSIADPSSLWVWCDLYERDLAALHKHLEGANKPKASVKVSAFDETFAGVVDLLGSTVDESTRTIKVRVSVKDDQGKLKPGMFATVEVDMPEGRKAILVPRKALLNDEGKQFVFVHWRDDLWLRRDVTTGAVQGDLVEIQDGVEPGSRIVVGGGFLFKSDVLRAKMGAGCAD